MADAEFIQHSVPPLPPRYRFRDLIRGDHATGGHAAAHGGDPHPHPADEK